MRWKVEDKKKYQPKLGDGRGRSGFLFRRKTIDGETRWLEYANWIEIYSYRNSNGRSEKELWIPTKWVPDFDDEVKERIKRGVS